MNTIDKRLHGNKRDPGGLLVLIGVAITGILQPENQSIFLISTERKKEIENKM